MLLQNLFLSVILLIKLLACIKHANQCLSLYHSDMLIYLALITSSFSPILLTLPQSSVSTYFFIHETKEAYAEWVNDDSAKSQNQLNLGVTRRYFMWKYTHKPQTNNDFTSKGQLDLWYKLYHTDYLIDCFPIIFLKHYEDMPVDCCAFMLGMTIPILKQSSWDDWIYFS